MPRAQIPPNRQKGRRSPRWLTPGTTEHPLVMAMTDHSRLGRSGLKISKVILGTMSFGDPSQGTPWTLPEEQALPLLYHAYKRGINTWDTADVYGQGTSEQIISKAIEEYKIPRSRLVILSKCYFGVDPELVKDGQTDMLMSSTNDGHMVNRVGLSRKHIFDAVSASVARYGAVSCRVPYITNLL